MSKKDQTTKQEILKKLQKLSPEEIKTLFSKNKEKICSNSSSQIVPLSIIQKRIWLMEQLQPELPFSNSPLALTLKGTLDKSVLSQSLTFILNRHEALRTIFPLHNGEPFQKVLQPWILSPEIIAIQNLSREQQIIEAKKIAQLEAQQKFDLQTGPLIRTKLLQLSESEHILLIIMHHIIFDGWSENILIDELNCLYNAMLSNQKPNLPELLIQYKDFTIWQEKRLNQEFLAKKLSYWQTKLADNLSTLELKTDFPRPNNFSYEGDNENLILSDSLTNSLVSLTQKKGVTLFMVFLATFQALLYRYTSQEKINVGVPIAGRNRKEIEGLIGLFMNTIVFCSDFSHDPTFNELLADVKQVSLEAYSHQELPFDKLVEVLKPNRDKNRWPIFQVLFNFRNLPTQQPQKENSLLIEKFNCPWGMIGGLDLILEITNISQQFHCKFTYPTQLFQQSTIQLLVQHFKLLLENAVAQPDKPLNQLNLLTDEERNKILRTWNSTQKHYPKSFCIHELFEQQVLKTPNNIAVVFEGEQLTYSQLNEEANQLAHYLKEKIITSNVTIGICIERSLEMIIGILAIIKAGCIYVPLDPEYPQERLNFMIEDSNIAALLTQNHLKPKLSNYQGLIITLDEDKYLWSEANKENLSPQLELNDNLYIIYTSGTTGKPKGVIVTHRGACNHLHWRHNYFPLTTSDKVLQKASLNFDDSFWEIFEPLTIGAQLILAPPYQHAEIQYLINTIIKNKVTTLCLVPSLLQVFLENPHASKCTTLKRVTTGGERLSVKVQEKFFQVLNADLYNGYGATETTIAVCYWKCQPNQAYSTVPIGKPINNTQVYILNSHLQPLPVGITGELYIAGDGLARGYLNRPDLTAQKFINNPFGDGQLYKTGDLARYLPDGNIEFIGRIDEQIKIRGFRVELGEIENNLLEHSNIKETVVVALENEQGEKYLVAYLITNESLKITEIRDYLTQKLPNYMLPSAFVFLDEFPLTPNGKIDKKALPKPDFENNRENEFIAPSNDIEIKLAQIWQEVLKVEKIGINDNFFSLGGHSLLATQIVSRIRTNFSLELPLIYLFEYPTIKSLSEHIILLKELLKMSYDDSIEL
jgi:amino acid adenylation domain-containing protein